MKTLVSDSSRGAGIGRWRLDGSVAARAGQVRRRRRPQHRQKAEFPEGAGREAFVKRAANVTSRASRQRRRQSREGWKKVIVAMEDRGAVLSKEDTRSSSTISPSTSARC